MRKIHFNEETIQQIRDYFAEGHTVEQVCNRFTLKYDTLKRVMFENNIQPFYKEKIASQRVITDDDVNLICNLYRYTNTRIQDIVKETKLPNYAVQKVLNDHFSEKFRNDRKSRLYRSSKLGDKNPMKDRTGYSHPNYKDVIDDGAGYLMEHRPEWWTSRNRSAYVYQHHIVIAKAIGLTEIPKGFVVHHIDGNPKNNDISNLALLNMGAHAKWHSMLKNLCKVQRLSEHGVGNPDDKDQTEDPNA